MTAAAASKARKVHAMPRELPEHVRASDEWKKWPRKIEAHVWYGARERQITALCRTGRLVVWSCPDDTLRIEPSQLEDLFGAPGTFQGRDRAPEDAAEREAKVATKKAPQPQIDVHDPLPGLVRELTAMLRETRTEKTEVLRLAVDPMNQAVKLLLSLTERMKDRIETLEDRELDVLALVEEMQSSGADREARRAETKAREERRGKLMALLEKELPKIFEQAVGNLSLAGFVKKLDPNLVMAVLEMPGALTPEQQAMLRKAAGMADSKANGKSDGTPPGGATDAGAEPANKAGVS